MRNFTEQENNLIKELVEIKKKGLSYIQELQVARILRTKFSFFALKWTYGNKPQISLYNRPEDKDKTEQQYYSICDFIYFIKELESLGFIAIQKISSEKENVGFSVLYDREKYIYNETDNQFKPKKYKDLGSLIPCSSDREILMEEMDDGVYVLFQIGQAQDINLDFAYDLQKYGLGIIYPLPLAADYVDNKFKSLEQRKHDEEMRVALKSAKESRWATIIAFFSLLVSVVFGIHQVCSPQEIEQKQIYSIETAIRNNRVEEPLEVEIGDTILTEPVENNQKATSCNQLIKPQNK